MTTGLLGRTSRRNLLEGMGIGALGIAGAALLGCGGDGDSGDTKTGQPAAGRIEGATQGAGLPEIAPKVQGNKKPGGKYSLASTSLPTQHDMHTALASTIWHLSGEKVLEQDPRTGKLLPHVASSWEVADPNGLSLVFKIQPNIKIINKAPWNGREFAAEDVAWNLERIGGLYAEREKTPLAAYQRASMVAGIQKAEAVDKYTVKVTMSKPNSAFFNGLVENRVPMMPKEMVDIGFSDPMKAGGIGAWEVTEWVKDKGASFKKHPEYFRKGEPYFDTMENLVVPDAAAADAAFISGQTQYLATPTPDAIALVRRGKPDANLYAKVDSNWQHFRLQVKDFPPFRDFRVRKGIFLIMDVSEMANGYYGDGWAYQSMLSPGYPEAWHPDKVKQLPGFNPATKEKDIAEGKKMLEAAGYPNGRGIDVEMRPNLATGVSYENAIRWQAQMARSLPEMKITIKPFPPGELAVPQSEGRFQMIAYTITCVPDPVLELQSQYHSQGSRNYGKFSDPGYDALVDKMMGELNFDRRKEMLDEAQRRWFDEWMAQYVLYAQPNKVMMQSNIGGFDETWGFWFVYGFWTKIHRWWYTDK
jgi:ABC-type transport system substrate-binding protein